MAELVIGLCAFVVAFILSMMLVKFAKGFNLCFEFTLQTSKNGQAAHHFNPGLFNGVDTTMPRLTIKVENSIAAPLTKRIQPLVKFVADSASERVTTKTHRVDNWVDKNNHNHANLL